MGMWMNEVVAGVTEGLKCRLASGGAFIRNEDRTESLMTPAWRPMRPHYGDTLTVLEGGWLCVCVSEEEVLAEEEARTRV